MSRALWFEEFEAGRAAETATRVVTDADIVAFAEVSGDRNPLHLDEEYARESIFGGRIAHGVLGLAVATGLLNELGLTRGTLLAFLGLSWQFKAPVRPGDEVRARVQVASARATRNPEAGLVKLALTLLNQRDEPIQEGEFTMLIRKRAADSTRPGA